MTTALDILVNARELISNEENWTKGMYAATSEGIHSYWRDNISTCFCSLGALKRSSYRLEGGVRYFTPEYRAAYSLLDQAQPSHDIVLFNDDSNTKHEDVLTAFDAAIDLAKAHV